MTKVVGPGAVWPQLDQQTVADNVWLEVDVGANGPPNRQEDVQVLAQLVPLLQRIPGISPEWLARQLIRRMGDDIDLDRGVRRGRALDGGAEPADGPAAAAGTRRPAGRSPGQRARP